MESKKFKEVIGKLKNLLAEGLSTEHIITQKLLGVKYYETEDMDANELIEQVRDGSDPQELVEGVIAVVDINKAIGRIMHGKIHATSTDERDIEAALLKQYGKGKIITKDNSLIVQDSGIILNRDNTFVLGFKNVINDQKKSEFASLLDRLPFAIQVKGLF